MIWQWNDYLSLLLIYDSENSFRISYCRSACQWKRLEEKEKKKMETQIEHSEPSNGSVTNSLQNCYQSLNLFGFPLVSLVWEEQVTVFSSMLAWKIPWMEDPGRLQSMGSQRVGHEWVTSLSFFFSFSFLSMRGAGYNSAVLLSRPKFERRHPFLGEWAEGTFLSYILLRSRFIPSSTSSTQAWWIWYLIYAKT